jgi:predicted Rossmann-fold nucleotide-binding protein
MRIFDVGDDGVADDCDGEGEEHYCAAEAEAVGDKCYEYCWLLVMCGLLRD